MKYFLKLIATSFLSALLFGVYFGILMVIENYYEISALENLIEGFTLGSIFSFPVYLTIGILFSYLSNWITNKVNPNKPYVLGLLMYSLLGLSVGVALLYRSVGFLNFLDILYFLGMGVLATNIFHHVLFLLNVLAKRKNEVIL